MFVTTVIESPSDLNSVLISFLILSIFGPLAWCITTVPSSLYKARPLNEVQTRNSTKTELPNDAPKKPSAIKIKKS